MAAKRQTQSTTTTAPKLTPLQNAWRHAATLRQTVETVAVDASGITAAKFNRMFATVDAYVSFAGYLREQIIPRLPAPEQTGITGNALYTLATTAGSAIYCADDTVRAELGSNAYFTRALQFAAMDTAAMRETYREQNADHPTYATYLKFLQVMSGAITPDASEWTVSRNRAGKVTAASKVAKTRGATGQRATRTTATAAAAAPAIAPAAAPVADLLAGDAAVWQAVVDAPESATLADLSAIPADKLLPLARLLLAAALLQSAPAAAPAPAGAGAVCYLPFCPVPFGAGLWRVPSAIPLPPW